MMKNNLLLFATLLALSATAQTRGYHPFPDSNAIWNFHAVLYGIPPSDQYYSVSLTGDTVINGVIYHKLMTPFVRTSDHYSGGDAVAGYKGAVRQDPAIRKVFIVPPDSITEQLLYDFTMKAGDTVRGFTETGLFPADVVESIDSVLVGNDYRKRWKINSGYNIYLIEGIGSTYGLIEHSPGTIVDWMDISLTCFRQDGKTIYPDTLTNCELITGVQPVLGQGDPVIVYPNPSRGSFTIGFSDPADIREVRLTDLTGNIILRQATHNRKTIEIDGLNNGIYFLIITDRDNRSLTRKIISCR
jgi:hypothetical protein